MVENVSSRLIAKTWACWHFFSSTAYIIYYTTNVNTITSHRIETPKEYLPRCVPLLGKKAQLKTGLRARPIPLSTWYANHMERVRKHIAGCTCWPDVRSLKPSGAGCLCCSSKLLIRWRTLDEQTSLQFNTFHLRVYLTRPFRLSEGTQVNPQPRVR